MSEFKLLATEIPGVFKGTFEMSRTFINELKSKKHLHNITNDFIDLLPETLEGEIIAEPENNWVKFKTNVGFNHNMNSLRSTNQGFNCPTKKKDKLSFTVLVQKNSSVWKEIKEQEITVSFN